MHSFTKHRSRSGEGSTSERQGIVSISAWLYDLVVRLLVMHGKEQTFRHMIADLAQLQSGEAALDVGCGTGTQAFIVKKRVGAAGRVCGIDPSVPLLAGARRKAERAGLSIDFQPGGIEQIVFPDQSFDIVLSTFMLHHVPDSLKRQGLAEIARVLKPGGRLLLIDFKRSEEHQGQGEHFGVGKIGLQELPSVLKETGFSQIETGEIPFRIRSLAAGHKHYGFVKAKKNLNEERSSV